MNTPTPGQEIEPEINLLESQLGLEKLAERGWLIESNGYNTFFRHKETRKVIGFPFWVKQLISQARADAKEEMQRNFRHLIGLERD